MPAMRLRPERRTLLCFVKFVVDDVLYTRSLLLLRYTVKRNHNSVSKLGMR